MLRKLVPFMIILSLTYFLSDADLFQEFTPRSVCMYQRKDLIMLHLVSNFTIFISYTVIGSSLFYVYTQLRKKKFPFAKFAWKFGGFIFFCGLTHMMGVINLWKTFYWIDGLLLLCTAWFSVLVCISFEQALPHITALKTPKEFAELADRYDKLIKKLEEERT